jgi:hypothetical protein
LFYFFIGDLSESEKDELRNEVNQVKKKVMEEMKRIEFGKNKEEIEKEMMKKIGMMKFIVCYCLRKEWNFTSNKEMEKIFKEVIIPVCESVLGKSEKGIVPSDSFNGDEILLDILYWRMDRSECQRLCCSEKKELFGRILRLSMDPVFHRTRETVFYLLCTLVTRGDSEEVEWMRKEGEIRCGMKRMKKTIERVNGVEDRICVFLSMFFENELKERREEKELLETERKDLREITWEIEEEGGGDIVIPHLHHLYEDIRLYSRLIVVVCGYVVEKNESEESDKNDEHREGKV